MFQKKECNHRKTRLIYLTSGPLFGGALLGDGPNDSGFETFIMVSVGSLLLGVFASMESINKLNEAFWAYYFS
ncbi:hypothetical protein JYT44_03800, partial [Caldithrix abyssi]|nr:hypothetical protein [Caldithrix abyssi]